NTELVRNLSVLYTAVYVPRYVIKELGRKAHVRHQLLNAMRRFSFLKKCSVESNTDAMLLYDRRLSPAFPIDRGEAEAIVQARELGVSEVIIDEKRGRRIAVAHSLRVRGVVGLLTELKRDKLISDVKPLIYKLMRDLSFRVDEGLLAKELAK